MTRTTRSTLLALALLSGSACFDPPEEDAGDAAFVTQAITNVLGRRPHSVHEVYALQTLEGELGREAVLRVLMEQPEFTDYWSDVLMDDLLVWREGAERAGGDACYTEQHLALSDHDELVDHLRFYQSTTPFCPSDDGLDLSGKTSSSAKKSASNTFSTKAPRDPEGLLVDPDAPDDRTGEEIARDDEIDRYIAAGDIAGLEAMLEEEALRDGVRVTPSLAAIELPLVEGFEFGDDDPDEFVYVPATSKAPESKGDCEKRFTMADVFAASLSQDRLDVLYRVSLAPQATFTVQTADERAAGYFLSSFLNRDMTCVACHSSHYSTTSATPRNGHWDRFEPASPIALETNAFSHTDDDGAWHDGSLGGLDAFREVKRIYRDRQWAEEGGIQPFGMDPSCTLHSGRDGFLDPDDFIPTGGGLAGYDDLHVMELMDLFGAGVAALDWNAVGPANSLDYGEPVDALENCEGCHDGDDAPTFETNAYQMPASRFFQIVAHGPPTGGAMNPYGEGVAAGITAHFVTTDIYRPPLQYQLPETAVAHLTAMSIVDNVFEEISGARLTTDAGFPRNPEAAEALDHLTRVFVDEGWSLRALLVEILTSTHVNRVAPVDSEMEGYPLPMVVEPFADVNELKVGVGLGDDANGQGDLVHRWSVRSLFRQIEHALDWPAPPMYPSDGDYLGPDFQRNLGARMNRRDLGFSEHNLPSALAWELEIGTCRNSAASFDFIDEVTSEKNGLSLQDAMLAVKERLITSPEWWVPDPFSTVAIPGDSSLSEYALAEELAGVPLTEPAHFRADVVRDYCAALLMSPQFLLAGLPADVPNVDSYIPCERGAVCSHDDYCELYATTAEIIGYDAADCSPYDGTIGWKSQ